MIDARLLVLLPEHEPAPLPVHVMHRDGRHAPPKARSFLDLAIAHLRANSAIAE